MQKSGKADACACCNTVGERKVALHSQMPGAESDLLYPSTYFQLVISRATLAKSDVEATSKDGKSNTKSEMELKLLDIPSFYDSKGYLA